MYKSRDEMTLEDRLDEILDAINGLNTYQSEYTQSYYKLEEILEVLKSIESRL